MDITDYTIFKNWERFKLYNSSQFEKNEIWKKWRKKFSKFLIFKIHTSHFGQIRLIPAAGWFSVI